MCAMRCAHANDPSQCVKMERGLVEVGGVELR
jgi:hypothetical protein